MNARAMPASPQHPSLRMLGLAQTLAEVAPRGLVRYLPGARDRHWARLRITIEAQGDTAARAALDALDSGTIAHFSQLQVAALMVAQLRDHGRYEACVALHDPDLTFAPASHSVFAGRGGGLDSLPVFRRLGQGARARFEKIYRLDSPCYRRLRFALCDVLPRHPAVRFPKFVSERPGTRLIAVETRFQRSGSRATAEFGCNIARKLATVPVDSIAQAADFAVPYWLEQNLKLVSERLGEYAHAAKGHASDVLSPACLTRAVQAAHARVMAQPRVFSHGDLNVTNFDANALVWDWDAADLRAYGYDSAYCCRDRGYDDARALLDLSARAVERPGSAQRDRLAFVYFTLALMPASHRQWHNPNLVREVAALLPDLLEAAP